MGGWKTGLWEGQLKLKARMMSAFLGLVQGSTVYKQMARNKGNNSKEYAA